MAAPPIYSSFSVPVVSAVPSVNAFQWSADGQACFITKAAVYLMTPDHGLNFDPSGALRAVSDRNKGSQTDEETVGWYRTLVQFDRALDYVWPEHSQSWSAIVLGSVDISLWAVTLSPSYISDYAGCILAALSSSMDFTLWAAGRNGLKREWNKIMDVTPFLLEYFSKDENTVRALKSQVVSIKWSQQADFEIRPAPLDNGSILVAGNRAGMILFFRYHDSKVDVAHAAQISDQWIVSLTTSSWTCLKPGTCEAHIAYGLSDGTVAVVKVRQRLKEGPSKSDNTIELTVEGDSEQVCASDSCQCTTLEWLETPRGNILVYAKPGLIHLWRPSAAVNVWSGEQHLTVPIPPSPHLSTAMSTLFPLAGLSYIRRRDSLLLCFADGAFRMLNNLFTVPVFDGSVSGGDDTMDVDSSTSTTSLSMTARQIFARVEPEKVDFELVNRISGMVGYDGGSVVAWVHEASRPGDMSYKHDAKHNSVFLVAKMWDDDADGNDEALLGELQGVLESARFAAGYAPAHLLRPFFFNLTSKKLNKLHARVLALLSVPSSSAEENVDHSRNIDIAPWSGGLQPEMRREFRQSLARHLFGWDEMLRLRMKLSMADFAWKGSDSDEKRILCGGVAQTVLNQISHRILRTVVRHLTAVAGCLGPADVPFVLRMVVQSLLPGSPPDLMAEGQALALKLNIGGLVSESNDTPNVNPTTDSEFPDADADAEGETDLFHSGGLNEKCPACQAEVPPHDITSAVCPNGHIWLRCSITTFLLATAFVRTCTGCSRKAFLPLSSGGPGSGTALPQTARGWVVEELLEAVHRCLFCGNGFVSVL
ncbi:putative zinc-finger of transcription factor IIIC complex-domain-containing protein [Roridomyces roridus]|uniref:Zinc-finger of transcription factor IIIC complex-domain-containing protein n=1 Tax=Roridomyces roridus TaxID=1738132 RepID=A0AAD7BI54_9AGAR|nr:putative zinc-finger of transcription factor IIIC complex-domain-containing protein [Roridomyces roridus]